MLKVEFYDNVDDRFVKYAVIASKSNGKWVFCKHKERTTYEIPGGHREYAEDGMKWAETALEGAERELKEETAAVSYQIEAICFYSVNDTSLADSDSETYGLLCYAEINKFDAQIDSEIELIQLFDCAPDNLTYPKIHPDLMARVTEYIAMKCCLNAADRSLK